MGILKWLADKSETLNKKTLEAAMMASFHRRMAELERNHSDQSEEQRITVALYDMLDNRYPGWDKEDKISIINKSKSCVGLIDFIFDYEQKHGRTKDGFKG